MSILLIGIALGFVLHLNTLVHAQSNPVVLSPFSMDSGFSGQQLPSCPTDLGDDVGSSVTGGASGTDVQTAFGEAIAACQVKWPGAVEAQTKEKNKARDKCIAVQGCEFSWHVDNVNCGDNSTPAADCSPAGQQPPGTIYACTVWGRVNYTHYECKRPVKPITPL